MFYSYRCLILSVTSAYLPEPHPGNASLVYGYIHSGCCCLFCSLLARPLCRLKINWYGATLLPSSSPGFHLHSPWLTEPWYNNFSNSTEMPWIVISFFFLAQAVYSIGVAMHLIVMQVVPATSSEDSQAIPAACPVFFSLKWRSYYILSYDFFIRQKIHLAPDLYSSVFSCIASNSLWYCDIWIRN